MGVALIGGELFSAERRVKSGEIVLTAVAICAVFNRCGSFLCF